jgi:hypothetical protein
MRKIKDSKLGFEVGSGLKRNQSKYSHEGICKLYGIKEKKNKMKKEVSITLKKYQATLEDAVKASVKLNSAEKALKELPTSYAIKTALMEIMGKRKHYDKVTRNSIHNIAVLELREGI